MVIFINLADISNIALLLSLIVHQIFNMHELQSEQCYYILMHPLCVLRTVVCSVRRARATPGARTHRAHSCATAMTASGSREAGRASVSAVACMITKCYYYSNASQIIKT